MVAEDAPHLVVMTFEMLKLQWTISAKATLYQCIKYVTMIWFSSWKWAFAHLFHPFTSSSPVSVCYSLVSPQLLLPTLHPSFPLYPIIPQHEYYTPFAPPYSASFFLFSSPFPPSNCLSPHTPPSPSPFLPIQTLAHNASASLSRSLSLFVSRIDDISAGECYCGNHITAPQGCH